jgi:hypothetical protein
MPVVYAYQHPEKGLIYQAQMDKENNIIRLWWLDPAADNQYPIPDNLKIDFKLLDPATQDNFVQYSKARGRIVLDVTLEAPGLKDNMKVWAVSNFLVPFTDLVKTVILDHNPRLPANELERVMNFGFSKIEMGCLHGILEFDYNQSVFHENIELENITNLYYLFGAETEDEIIKYCNLFRKKTLIPQYLLILRQIIKNKATFNTKLATPKGHHQESYFDRTRSVKIKKIINNKMPPKSTEETAVGILSRIDFDAGKLTRFALHSTTDDQVYGGIIDPSLDERMRELQLNFMGKEYECKMRVIFSPESNVNPEKYDYILLAISEVLVVNNERLNC